MPVTQASVTPIGTIFIIQEMRRGARKRGTMGAKYSVYLTRRIGQTTYKVRVYLSEDAGETMEDKILRLIRNDGLAKDENRGIMSVPQMSRQSERSA